MAKEIERRFLLRQLSPDAPKPDRIEEIEQGYIEMASINESFRMRISDGHLAAVTYKIGQGQERDELPLVIPDLNAAREFMTKCHHRFRKTRHYIQDWEIDFYAPPLKNVILAEKEQSAMNDILTLPRWLGPVMEVTDSLTNLHLARLTSDLSGTNVLAMPYIRNQIFGKVFKVVITGGPCSGKSEIISKLERERPDFRCVPEMASILMGDFKLRPGSNQLNNKQFQKTIYRAQEVIEVTSAQFAASEGKVALLFDRGKPDGEAYMEGGQAEFESTLHTSKTSEYKHYDAVICLDVAPRHVFEIKKTNNPNRMETYEEAVHLGERIQQAWRDHPGYTFIPNGTSWADKESRVLQAINKMIF